MLNADYILDPWFNMGNPFSLEPVMVLAVYVVNL